MRKLMFACRDSNSIGRKWLVLSSPIPLLISARGRGLFTSGCAHVVGGHPDVP